jgi:hypothetical protein
MEFQSASRRSRRMRVVETPMRIEPNCSVVLDAALAVGAAAPAPVPLDAATPAPGILAVETFAADGAPVVAAGSALETPGGASAVVGATVGGELGSRRISSGCCTSNVRSPEMAWNCSSGP